MVLKQAGVCKMGGLLSQYGVHYVIKSIGKLTFLSVLHRAILLFICIDREKKKSHNKDSLIYSLFTIM